jgi:Tfp pilus assembly protein PilF
MSNRVEALRQILSEHPNEAMPRYSLALEFSNAGDDAAALREFEILLKAHPDYTPGYQMAAQTLLRMGRDTDAKEMLQAGIACATRTGNVHARSEMEGALAEMG